MSPVPQVRVGHVAEGGRVETQRLAFHTGRAHKLALEPEAPTCFLSCGEDGAVRNIFITCCDGCCAVAWMAHAPIDRCYLRSLTALVR